MKTIERQSPIADRREHKSIENGKPQIRITLWVPKICNIDFHKEYLKSIFEKEVNEADFEEGKRATLIFTKEDDDYEIKKGDEYRRTLFNYETQEKIYDSGWIKIKSNEGVLDDVISNRTPARVIGILPIRTQAQWDVHQLFFDEEEDLTITQIATITGLSRNTVYRVCRYLTFHQYIERLSNHAYHILDREWAVTVPTNEDIDTL